MVETRQVLEQAKHAGVYFIQWLTILLPALALWIGLSCGIDNAASLRAYDLELMDRERVAEQQNAEDEAALDDE